MELSTPRLILREYRHGDFDAVRAYESRSETQRYEKVAIPSEEDTRRYLADSRAWAQEEPRTRYRLALTIRPADAVHGRISLLPTFPEIREWEIGWTVDPNCWGRGYATEAALKMLGFAFEKAGAHRVVAFCNANNQASVRVMEKIGMQRDAHLRETLWWNGAWTDEFVYSILEREWQGRSV